MVLKHVHLHHLVRSVFTIATLKMCFNKIILLHNIYSKTILRKAIVSRELHPLLVF